MEACEAKTLRESKSDKQFGGPGTRKRNEAVHQKKVLQELAVNATTKTGQEGKIVEEVAEEDERQQLPPQDTSNNTAAVIDQISEGAEGAGETKEDNAPPEQLDEFSSVTSFDANLEITEDLSDTEVLLSDNTHAKSVVPEVPTEQSSTQVVSTQDGIIAPKLHLFSSKFIS